MKIRLVVFVSILSLMIPMIILTLNRNEKKTAVIRTKPADTLTAEIIDCTVIPGSASTQDPGLSQVTVQWSGAPADAEILLSATIWGLEITEYGSGELGFLTLSMLAEVPWKHIRLSVFSGDSVDLGNCH